MWAARLEGFGGGRFSHALNLRRSDADTAAVPMLVRRRMRLMQRPNTQRRRRLALAGALVVATFSATVALGANLGLFGLTQADSGVGRLNDHQVPVTTVHRGAAPSTPHDGRLDDD
jgi:hypothetical protein